MESLSSFPCVDEVRALPSPPVVLSDGSSGTTTRSDCRSTARHFPGSAVIGRASLPATPQATGPRRLSPVPRPTIHTFHAQYAGGFLDARSPTKSVFHGLRPSHTGSAPSPARGRGLLDDAYSGFTRVADRAVASTPLRTRPLDHARGHHYQGPRRLPGPDSHRQANLNLSLGLCHDELPFIKRPSRLGARGLSSRRVRQRPWRPARCGGRRRGE